MSIMSRPSVRLALVGATFVLLAACGNKGPLVMPQKPVPVEAQPVPQPQPADASQPLDQSTPAPVDGDTKPASTTDQPASSGNER
ncbi:MULTISPECIES: LPS translocon maturation chaperone LptM [Xanthomonas]|uniref:Sugar transporter n=3 Tax=Xanthomonas phaseoli TaxID=1985254 RepID=A0AB38E174_XANCH|nr:MULTISPECIES: lipoprotein [Xanthomonas]MBO9738378.1 lipoprotein [Xanthomonas axonopodis pv. begoniae]ATS23784.1 lipoprotein [Xanthomonas phaseoli pv. phaseoli]ATS26676.1 lipoprotein [Xanthomonas phaseoli pv. phaseoli]ATS29847.1 lipoprotein [Xanthomonas phaseoli pv. phaseoli]ATS34938.1 lipoprotein [Xanthomonas phaseoli pv. phaseoli]